MAVPDLSTQRLVARIRAAFPDLIFQRVRRIEAGDDHVVLLLDEATVFRFPRNAERAAPFSAELALLAALGPRSPVAIPDYRWIGPDRAFGGYRLIAGEELRATRFAALAPAIQRRIVLQIGEFLSVLHALPHDLVARPNGAVARGWSGADYARQYAQTRRALIAPFAGPALMGRIDAFYGRFADLAAGPPRLRHDDLTDDHLLLAPDGQGLAGIIDFADASIGDAAVDVCFLWRFGGWAPRLALSAYNLAAGDPDLLDRSLWSYARFQIERLYRAPAGEGAWLPGEVARVLTMLGID